MQCVERAAASLTFETEFQVPKKGWHIEFLVTDGLLPGSWTSADNTCREVFNKRRIRVGGLTPDTGYQFRLVRVNDDGRPTSVGPFCTCRTVGRPETPHEPSCLRRLPHALGVEWTIDDVTIPVTECRLQYRADNFYSTWQEIDSKLYFRREAQSETRWHCMVDGLQGATDYLLRVAAQNTVGWSDFSEPCSARTSEKPFQPRIQEVIARGPGSVVLAFVVEDPEGAPVLDVTAEVAGALQWQSHNCVALDLPAVPKLDAAAPRRSTTFGGGGIGGTRERGVSSIGGMAYLRQSLLPTKSVNTTRRGTFGLEQLPDAEVSVRIFSRNVVGRSDDASEVFKCRPAERPEPVRSFRCVGRGLGFVELEWSTVDPEGAEISECFIDYAVDRMLGTWQSAIVNRASAIPVAKPHSDDSATLQSGTHLWRARIDFPAKDEAYAMKVRPKNVVGVSDDTTTFACRPAERPPKPKVVCESFSAKYIILTVEYEVASSQLKHVDPAAAVNVECSSTLAWQTLPEVEYLIVQPQGKSTKERAEYVKVVLRVTVSSLEPHTFYKLRVWVANTVGVCKEPSDPLECQTSTRPVAPLDVRPRALAPRRVLFRWSVRDPVGAPVIGAEVEAQEQGVFGSRAFDPCPEMLRQRDQNPQSWEQVIDGLRPSTRINFRVRVLNVAGYSPWSAWMPCSTPSIPAVSDLKLKHVKSNTERHNLPGMDSFLVLTFKTNEPQGAPVFACIAGHGDDLQGQRALALRRGGRNWAAYFPWCSEDAEQYLSFTVQAVNSVGQADATATLYVKSVEVCSTMSEVVASAHPYHVTEITRTVLVAELSWRRHWERVLDRLSDSAREQEDRVLQDRLRKRRRAIESVQEALENMLECVKPGKCPRLDAWVDRCHKWEEHEPGGRAPNKADVRKLDYNLLVLQLLIEGGLWIERHHHESVEPLFSQLCDAAETSAWGSRRTEWSQNFWREFLGTWSSCFATALQIFAALDNGGDPTEAFANVKKSVFLMSSLVQKIEAQVEKLQQEGARLERVTLGAEVALSIYDIRSVSGLNTLTEFAGLGGAYHVGVEVYWLEWSYGWCANGSGVHAVHIGESTIGTFKERVSLGRTDFSPRVVIAILDELRRAWPGRSYHVLHQNCVHFSAEFLRQLRVGEVPSWVSKLATTGDNLTHWFRSSNHAAGSHSSDASEGGPHNPIVYEEDPTARSTAFTFGDREIAHEQCKDGYLELSSKAQASASEGEAPELYRANSEDLMYDEEELWLWARDFVLGRAAEAMYAQRKVALADWKTFGLSSGRARARARASLERDHVACIVNDSDSEPHVTRQE